MKFVGPLTSGIAGRHCTAILSHSLVRSLAPLIRGTVSDWMVIYTVFSSILAHSGWETCVGIGGSIVSVLCIRKPLVLRGKRMQKYAFLFLTNRWIEHCIRPTLPI